jgi:HEAT repeat protein
MVRKTFVGVLLATAALAGPARAYVDCALTLGQLVRDSAGVVVLRVEQVSREKQVIVFRKVADLKGRSPDGLVRHLVARGLHPREPRLVLDWAEPGRLAVAFSDGRAALTCVGRYWYESAPRGEGWWAMTCGRPDLSLAYCGPAGRLQDAVGVIVAGGEAVVPAVRYDAGGEYRQRTDFKGTLRGRDCPVCRVRASLRIGGTVPEAMRRPGYVVGPGAGGPEDVPGLVRALQDPDGRRRADAAEELGLIGPAAREAVGPLRAAVQDADGLVRTRAAAALASIDPEDKNPVPTLIAALGNVTAAVRKEAAGALGDLGAAARAAVPDLARALKDADAAVRWAAAEALGRMGPAAEAAVPALIEALNDKAVSAAATDALGWVGPAARPAAMLLRIGLRLDGDTEAQRVAAWALLRIGGDEAKDAIPVLIHELKSDDWHNRRDAATFLWGLGTAAREAAPALTEALHDAHPHVRWAAAGALVAALGPKADAALPALLAALKDRDNVLTRRYAPAVLMSLGPTARPALPALTEALRDPDADVRRCAAAALMQLGPAPEKMLPAVTEALRGSDLAYVRRQALAALTSLGPRAKPAVPAVRAALGDPDADVRRWAEAALRRIDPEAGRPLRRSD